MAGQYSITTDLIKKRLGEPRVIQLTDDNNTGAIDQGNVDEAIVAAEEELHLYAGVYYAIPLRLSDGTTPPTGIKKLLLDSTCWHLMTRRSEFMRNGQDEGEYWEKRRKEIVTWLKSIAEPESEKRLLIPGATEPTITIEPRGGEAQVCADEETFGAGFME